MKKIALLGVMEVFCPFCRKTQRQKNKNRASRHYWVMTFVLLLFCSAIMAQQPTHIIGPVKVGDKLAEHFWQQEHIIYHNGKTSKQTLAQYRDKLLILDFWATWCSSCIKKFAFADSLNRKYDQQVMVLLVNSIGTKDTEEKINTTLANYGRSLQTVNKDTLLKQLFPHAQLPHYVWIEQGQVRAITGAEFFTKENIEGSVQRRKQLNETIQKRKRLKL
jgi:thiol-disulfide isomerase/thioredoxin